MSERSGGGVEEDEKMSRATITKTNPLNSYSHLLRSAQLSLRESRVPVGLRCNKNFLERNNPQEEELVRAAGRGRQ